MTIKELAYSAQQYLQSNTDSTFKRSHIYELLAASFGFGSYASLCSESILTQQGSTATLTQQYPEKIIQRSIDLGYRSTIADAIASQLPVYLKERNINVVNLSDLVSDLYDQYQQSGGCPQWEGEFPSILIDGLESLASRGEQLAHFGLALIYAPEEEAVEGEYWYSQGQRGRELSGVEREWAENYSQHLAQAEKCRFHFQEAARLGDVRALLKLAERFDDPTFFEKDNTNVSVDVEPLRVVEIAEQLGRMADVQHWLVIAAKAGDTGAMRRLIEEFDSADLQRCWTWLYLARLLDTDLTKDAHYAINEDGSLYDDDVGGPAYVDGEDGVRLDPLSAEQDAVARQYAEKLFNQIDPSE